MRQRCHELLALAVDPSGATAVNDDGEEIVIEEVADEADGEMATTDGGQTPSLVLLEL